MTEAGLGMGADIGFHLLPVIVIGVPGPPVVGVILLMLGLDSTVNGDPLLEVPFTVTTTFPVPILVGIGTTDETSGGGRVSKLRLRVEVLPGEDLFRGLGARDARNECGDAEYERQPHGDRRRQETGGAGSRSRPVRSTRRWPTASAWRA